MITNPHTLTDDPARSAVTWTATWTQKVHVGETAPSGSWVPMTWATAVATLQAELARNLNRWAGPSETEQAQYRNVLDQLAEYKGSDPTALFFDLPRHVLTIRSK